MSFLFCYEYNVALSNHKILKLSEYVEYERIYSIDICAHLRLSFYLWISKIFVKMNQHCLYFTSGKTKAQRSYLTHSRTHQDSGENKRVPRHLIRYLNQEHKFSYKQWKQWKVVLHLCTWNCLLGGLYSACTATLIQALYSPKVTH